MAASWHNETIRYRLQFSFLQLLKYMKCALNPFSARIKSTRNWNGVELNWSDMVQFSIGLQPNRNWIGHFVGTFNISISKYSATSVNNCRYLNSMFNECVQCPYVASGRELFQLNYWTKPNLNEFNSSQSFTLNILKNISQMKSQEK